jgi:two-component sensor histidine kinase/putative methionine-R-sulfoxide reductase with GAF domain
MEIVAASSGSAGTGCPRHRAALAAFSSYALTEPDLDDLLDGAARASAEALGAPLCWVMQYRADEDDLFLRSGVGWPAGAVGRLKVPADQTNPAGRTFVSGEPVITPDTGALPASTFPPFFARHGILSSVCVPIQGSNGTFGTLGVDCTGLRVFENDDVEFLSGFARVVAEAISRIRRKRALDKALQKKEALADERGVLLREMQHRVRNHLQLIQSSLSIQARRTEDMAARQGFQEVAGQVLALSTLYDHLLGVGMGRTIDFASYLASLCDSMGRVTGLNGGKVNLIFTATQHVTLGLDRCTALGIAVNELVSNALEHAFSGDEGKVEVSLGAAGPGEALLIVMDDGSGLDRQLRRGVGMTLVERLVKQVEGSIEVNASSGTVWKITFPLL